MATEKKLPSSSLKEIKAQFEQPPRYSSESESFSVKNQLLKNIDSFANELDSKTKARASERDLVEAREAFSRETIKIGNLEIDFIGLSHSPETLLLFRSEIETAILDSNFIITESAPEASGDIETIISKSGSRFIELDSSTNFFLSVEYLAKKHDKTVGIVDPGSVQNTVEIAINNEGNQLGELNQKLHEYKTIGGSMGVLIAGAVAAYELSKGMGSTLQQNRSNDTEKEGNMSRRNFLKAGVAAGVTVAIGKVTSDNLSYHRQSSKDDLERMTLYDLLDYRDVVAAEALAMLGEGFKTTQKAVVIYGRGHMNGIIEYLKSPNKRGAKSTLYKPFKNIAQPRMVAYKFNIAKELGGDSKKRFGEWKRTLSTNVD